MYDPVPDLAALIEGMEAIVSAASLGASNSQIVLRTGELAGGPYARLRSGLLLDEPGLEHLPVADALRDALDEARNPPRPPVPVVNEETSYALTDPAFDPPRDLPVVDASSAAISYVRLVNYYQKVWPEEKTRAVRERLLELARKLPEAERARMPGWLLVAIDTPEGP
jgi:hypothetical protein